MKLRMKEVLKEKGVTSVWLSSQIGITRPNTSNIVSGKRKPSLDTLERIALALCVPVTDLFEPPSTDVITCPKCGTKFRMEE